MSGRIVRRAGPDCHLPDFPLTFYKSQATLSALVEYLGGSMSEARVDLLQGTLDLLILKTLLSGPMHGWGILQRIQQMSKELPRVQQAFSGRK